MKLINNPLMKDDCGHGENCCCSPKTWKDQFISLVLIICNFVFSGCTVSVLMWKQRLAENYEKNILLFCLKFMKKNIMLFCLKFCGKFLLFWSKFVFFMFPSKYSLKFCRSFCFINFPPVCYMAAASVSSSPRLFLLSLFLNDILKTMYCHINIDYGLMIRLSSWLIWKWISSII